MVTKRYSARLAAAVVLAAVAFSTGAAGAPKAQLPTDASEAKLLAVLQSGTTPEKAITCKQLAIYGSKEAVPALAPLLLDKELSSWARIALEAIPGPESEAALRDAVGKLQGRLLIGVMNSLGVRHDAKAVELLAPKMKDADAEVASCAAATIGKIGGEQAAGILLAALGGASTETRSAVAEGCIRCAEGFLAAGKQENAVKLYDAVCKADVSRQRTAEATRGAILARQGAGAPMLAEALKSTERTMFNMALRTARELTVPEVTDVLLAELAKPTPSRQTLLIVALADRGDVKALPAIVALAKSGSTEVRIVATSVIERLGDASCVPVLLEAAVSPEAQLAQTARTTLARLPGKAVEADLLARMQQTNGKTRQVLIELAALRRIDGALPVIAKCVDDADPGVRAVAIDTIGAIGEDAQAVELVKMFGKSQDMQERGNIEKALMAISGRCGPACVPHLLPMCKSTDLAIRKAAIRTLACCGGAEAMAAVKAAVADKEEEVQTEAVRTLSTWANRWPEDATVTAPLLDLAKSATTPQHRILALRGYLQYVQGSKKLPEAEKLKLIDDILPLLTRPEEKRLAVSTLSAIGSAAAMRQIVSFAADPALVEESCSAIVNSKHLNRLPKPERLKALQMVVEKSKYEATRKKAEEAMKGLK